MDIDPTRAIEYIQKNAEVFSEAKSERVRIEAYLKYLKASLMNKSESNSLGAKETYAYSHPEYLEQINGLKVAVEAEERMKYMLEAAKMKVEVWKTQEYTKRVEMKL